MLIPPLPRHADLRKLVASGARLAGTVSLAELSRMAAVLLSSAGVVNVELRGSVDDEGFRIVTGTITGSLELQCQRCLERMQYVMDARLQLALVWREDEIVALPARLDGLVAGTDPCDVYELVEEELLLSLPLAPRHEDACQVRGFVPAVPETQPSQPSPGPFAALGEIKRGS